MNPDNYLRGSELDRKYVIYDIERDAYVSSKLTNDNNVLEIHYVDDVRDATFCNSMRQVVDDLEKAGISITDNIKIIGINITLTITPDFITDYSDKVKPPPEVKFDPVPVADSDTIQKLKKQIIEAQHKVLKEQEQQIREELAERQAKQKKKDYNPTDISTNQFL